MADIRRIGSNVVVFVEADKITLLHFKGESYVDIVASDLCNGEFTFRGHTYSTARLKQADNRQLVLSARYMRENRNALKAVRDAIVGQNRIVGMDAPTATYAELEMALVGLCDSWLGFPNECAYTDSILDQIVAIANGLTK